MNPRAAADALSMLRSARGVRLRTMREFAEAEIAIPDGPYRGRRFRAHRQPYAGVLLDAFDSGKWDRFVVTGPTQSGKTLTAYCIPTLYHLCELGENVIAGVPDMRMARDKWEQDLLPVISASPTLRRLLPVRGGGSRGGKVESVTLTNGATLRFMSGGGGDKARAGFTARVLVVTETDGMDEPGEASREADKITQLEARTRAYTAATGLRKRVYLECTVSTVEGRTWSEYQAGTASRLLMRCATCDSWVLPEREHLVGWQDAEDVMAAFDGARFCCPSCGSLWSDGERQEALQDLRMAHKGQEIEPDGSVTGDAPRTDTLGFRWTAAHNAFVAAGDVGRDEWRAQRNQDTQSAEREQCQFVWAVPYIPDVEDMTGVAAPAVASRAIELIRGMVPGDTSTLTCGLDIGQRLSHWVLLAFRARGQVHVVDYGRLEVPSNEMTVERALAVSLRGFRDELILTGWPTEGGGENRSPERVWIDSGWHVSTEVVYRFCRESGKSWSPILGHGAAQKRIAYSHPASKLPPPTAGQRQRRTVTHHVGLRYYLEALLRERVSLVHIDGDFWKTWTHKRLQTEISEVGAMTLWRGTEVQHRSFAHHLAAERQYEELRNGRLILRWEMKSRINHWLDATYIACAAAHYAGWRLLEGECKFAQPAAPPAYQRAGESVSVAQRGEREVVSGGRKWKIGR